MIMKKTLTRSFIMLFYLLLLLPQVNGASEKDNVFIQTNEMVVFDNNGVLNVIHTFYIDVKTDQANIRLNFPQNIKGLAIVEGGDEKKNEIKNQIAYLPLNKGTNKVMVVYGFDQKLDSFTYDYKQVLWTKEMNVTVQVGKVATQAQGFLTQSKAIDINENKFRQFTRLNIQKNEDWPIMFKKMTFTSQGEENVRADYTADGLKIIGHNDPNAWSPVFNFGLIIFIFTIGLISIRVTMNYHRDRLHLSSREELLAELSELHRKKESGMISTSQYQAHYQQVYSSLLDIACRQERNE